MDIRHKYKVVYFINQIFGLYFSYGSPAKFRGGGQGLIPNNQNRFVLLSGNAV